MKLVFSFVCLSSAKNVLLLCCGLVFVCFCFCFFFKVTLSEDTMLLQVVIPVKSSGNTWRDFLAECVQPVYQLFFLLAAQLLLLWKCFDVDLLEIVDVVDCLCKSWPFSVT